MVSRAAERAIERAKRKAAENSGNSIPSSGTTSTIQQGEGVFQDPTSGKIYVRDGDGFREVTSQVVVTRPGVSGGRSRGRGSSGLPPTPTPQVKTSAQISSEQQRQQEQARQQAEDQKRQELISTRNRRVEELARQNVESGISSGQSARANAERVILTRDAVAIRDAGKEARARSGPTGEVKRAPKKSVVQKVKDAPAKIKEKAEKKIDIVKVTGGGVSKFREKVVVPLREKLPSLGETPIGIVASDLRTAKRIIESKQPGETVKIGLPGQIREVEVSKLQNLSPLTFGGKIAVGESAKALKDITETYQEKVVVPLSESKVFESVEEKFIVPVSEKIIQPTFKGVKKGVSYYREKVVVPLREKLPSLGETPIGQIAEAKRIIDRKSKEFESITQSVFEEGISQEELSSRLSRFEAGGGTVTEIKDGDKTTFQLSGGPTVKIGLPGQIREVPVSKFQREGLIGFGKEIFLGEVEKSFTDILKADIPTIKKSPGFERRAEVGGKVARFGTEILSYSLPGVFVGEVALKATEAQLAGGAFGGPESAFEFVLENPLETTLAIAAGTGSLIKVAKTRRAKKIQELISIPEKKALVLETRIAKESSKQKFIKPKLEISKIDDVTRAVSVPKSKGRFLKTDYIPEARQTGKVFELRKIGKKLKTFEGTAEVSGTGTLKETIKIKDITKVTEITSSGKGSVKLLKRGKIIFERELKQPPLPKLKYLRPKVNKLKIDKQFGQPGVTIDELIVKRGGKVGKAGSITDDAGNLLISDTKQSLKSKLVTGEFKSTRITGKDIESGITQSIQKEQSFLDVINVGERKASIKTVGGKGSGEFRRRLSQEIEFGIDETFDKTLFGKAGKQKIVVKSITPNIQRDITQFSGQRTVTTFIKPTSKEVKLLKKTSDKLLKSRKAKVDLIDRALVREEFDNLVKKITKSQESKVLTRKENIKNLFSKSGSQDKVRDIVRVESKYAFGQELNLPRKVFVEPTEQFLRPVSSPQSQVPFISGIDTPVRSRGAGVGVVGTSTLLNVENVPAATLEIKSQVSSPILDLNIKQDIMAKQDIIVKTDTLIKTISRSRQNQFNKSIQQQIPQQIQYQKQEQLQKQTQRQIQQQTQQARELTNIKSSLRLPQETSKQKIELKVPKLIIPRSVAPRTRGPSFGVQIRRGGQFFNVGTFKTQRGAFERGKELVSGSLAATFRLTSPGKVPKAPKGFRTKSTPLGKLFIEKKGKRLSRKSETREIQAAKGRAPKKKTKKKASTSPTSPTSRKKKKKGLSSFF